MYREIGKTAEEMQEDLKEWRRDFHRYPETGWLEMRTSSKIAAELNRLGYEVLVGTEVCKPEARMGLPAAEELEEHYRWAKANGGEEAFLPDTKGGHTGVIGILRCGAGPVVALRFDMDALPVQEETGWAAFAQEKTEGAVNCDSGTCLAETGKADKTVNSNPSAHFPAQNGFASKVPGKMHACGHDGHMVIGLGTARLLAGMKGQLTGTIKLIFQPAEEGVRGARAIVEKGHLEDVDYVLGSHLSLSANGRCYMGPGMAGTLATTKLDVHFKGKSTHAGISPQEGANALLAAAAAVVNLYGIPRHGGGSSRINVGNLHAEGGRNVICGSSRLELEVRGETTEINAYMEAYARRILEHSAMMHGCTVTMEQVGGTASLRCTKELTELVAEVCKEEIGLEVAEPVPMGASEDFACMAEAVIAHGGQVCFTGIHIPCTSTLHSNTFDFDERALVLGVKLYGAVVWKLLKRK